MKYHLAGLWVLATAAAAEILALCTVLGAEHMFRLEDHAGVFLYDLQVDPWLGTAIGSLYVGVGAWALARRLPEGQQLRRLALGAGVGLAAACFDRLIQVGSGVPLEELAVVSILVRIAAGSLGGLSPAWPASRK